MSVEFVNQLARAGASLRHLPSGSVEVTATTNELRSLLAAPPAGVSFARLVEVVMGHPAVPSEWAGRVTSEFNKYEFREGDKVAILRAAAGNASLDGDVLSRVAELASGRPSVLRVFARNANTPTCVLDEVAETALGSDSAEVFQSVGLSVIYHPNTSDVTRGSLIAGLEKVTLDDRLPERVRDEAKRALLTLAADGYGDHMDPGLLTGLMLEVAAS